MAIRWCEYLGLLLFIVLGGACLSFPFPQIGGDELGHLSYALQLRDHQFLPPDLHHLVMYDVTTRLPTQDLNYINHPATGYYPLAAFLAVIPHASIATLRMFCFIPALLAYLLYLAIGRAQAPKELYLLYTMFPSILAFPVHLMGITVDAWGMLGGTCAVLGCLRWQENKSYWAGLLLVGAALASTKLNSWMLAGLFTAAYVAYYHGILLVRDRRWCGLFLAALVFTLPYLWLLIVWHSPTPTTPGQFVLLQQGPAILHHLTTPPSPGILGYLWFALVSFADYMPGSGTFSGLYGVILALVLFGLLRSLVLTFRTGQPLLSATAWAWFVTFGVHVTFSYLRYRDYQWPLDFYPRYYLALLPGFGLTLTHMLMAFWRHMKALARLALNRYKRAHG